MYVGQSYKDQQVHKGVKVHACPSTVVTERQGPVFASPDKLVPRLQLRRQPVKRSRTLVTALDIYLLAFYVVLLFKQIELTFLVARLLDVVERT